MWDFSMSKAMGLMIKTLPFIVFRIIVYFGISAAFVAATGVGAGIGWGIGAFGADDFQASSTFYGGAIGFAVASTVLYFLREYLLYMVKAGHIAVLVELMDGKEIPGGRAQIEHAQGVVKERFKEANVLFALDQIITGVIRMITGMLEGIASFIPIPALQNMVGVIKAFLKIALGFLDEIILAYIIRKRSTNPWETSQEALVLYAQNSKHIIKNAAFLAVFVYVLAFIVFLLALAPAAAVVYFFPGPATAGGFVFALIFAWAVKQAFLEPFAIACMMQVYFEVIEDQTPDPVWEGHLNNVSKKFVKLKERAVKWAGGKAGTPSPEV